MPLTTYLSGDVLTAASLNANLAVAASGQKAVFNETQANNTNGGTNTTGSFAKRTLNTTIVNTITGCTLTSSVISLPAGTYSVTAFGPAHNTNRTKVRLQNTTDSTTLILGQSEFCEATQTSAHLQGVFTLAATKNVELQQRHQMLITTNGLGVPSNFGVDEIYSLIEITQIA